MRNAMGLLLCLGGIGTASAESGHHRHVDAHEHGSSELNIAIEGETLSLEYMAPAYDIIGFEYTPESSQEKATLDEAREKLRDGIALFGIPKAAECESVEREIEATFESLEEKHDDHGEHNDHGEHHEHEKDHDHHADKDHDHGGEDAHAEFHAIYEYRCEAPSELDEWEVEVFDEFPNASEIQVQAISENGQTAHRLSRNKSTLDLSEILN